MRAKKILKITAIIIIFLLFGLWIVWKDEPPPDDRDLQVVRVEIPEDKNAFYHISRAVEKMNFPEDKIVFIENMLAGEEWDSAFADNLVKKNEESFPLFDKAMVLPHLQPPDAVELDYIQSLFNFSRLVSIKIIHLSEKGKDKEAFDEAVKLIKFGSMIQEAKRGIIYYLAGTGIKGHGLFGLQRILTGTGLSPDVLKIYVRALDEFRSSARGLTSAFKFEYMQTRDMLEGKGNHFAQELSNEELNSWKTFSSRSSFFYKPNKSKRLYLEHYRDMIANISKPCINITSPEPPETSSIKKFLSGNPIGEIIFNIASPVYWPILQRKCREYFFVTGTQLLIAIKVYQSETGKLPDSLSTLVPEYFPEVPVDPFDGNPLRYSAGKKIIYSVGEDARNVNGTDENFTIRIEF